MLNQNLIITQTSYFSIKVFDVIPPDDSNNEV